MESNSFIQYKSADIYFIFSFLLDLKEPYSELVNQLEAVNKNLKKKKCEPWKIREPPHERESKPPMLMIKREGGNSGERKYISTAVYRKLISSEQITIVYKEGCEKEKSKSQVTADIEAFVRLGDNGAGCITFKISVPGENDQENEGYGNVNLLKIFYLLSLSQRHYNEDKGISKLKFTSDSLFTTVMETYLKNEKSSEYRLFDVFAAGLESICQEINNFSETKSKYVEIQDQYLMDFNDSKLVAQNPYVLSVIEVKGSKDEALFWQEDAFHQEMTRDEYKELSTILFRMVYPEQELREDLKSTIKNIRIPYELRSSEGLLKNYAWDTRILMCFSRVSSLFACTDKKKSPASFICHTLLDSLEILRARWHMSIVINALLDQDIASIKSEVSYDNLEALGRLINRRRQFAYFLDDPLPYHYEGSSVTQIIAEADEELWLSKLRKMTFEKLEILDKLFKDQMEYNRILQFIEEEKNLFKRKFL